MTSSTRGQLGQGVLPLLLRRVHVQQSTGLLHLQRGEERGSICFVEGRLAWGDTNIEECRLGECLVRHGRLTEGDHLRASLMVGDGQRLGQVLLELGLLDAPGLEEALALHVREILMTVVSWGDGVWQLEQPLPEALRAYATPLPFSAAEVILDAVWSLPDPAAVSYALGDLSRPLVMSTDGRLRAQQVNFTSEDGFILSRVDGTATASEVLDISGLDRGEAERRLFALICIGVIDYGEVPKTRQPALARHTQEPVVLAPTESAEPAGPYTQDHVVPLIRLSLGADSGVAPEPDAAAPAAASVEPASDEAAPGPRQRLAQLRHMMQDPSRRKMAERALRAFLVEEPNCADAYHLLGLIAREHGAELRAQAFFRKAVEIDPQHASVSEISGAGSDAETPSFFRRMLSR